MTLLSAIPNDPRKRIYAYIFVSAILLYFIFSPAINALYYAHDDYRYAFGGFSKACKTDDGFEFMMTLGRPIQAYMDCAVYKFAYTFERMKIVRMMSVVLLACGMGLLIEWLSSLGIAVGVAFLVSACFFLIPNMNSDAILTASQPLALAIVLVLLAYRCLNAAHRETIQKLRQCWLLKGGALMLAALLTYPAMAFFFGTLMLTKVLFSPLQDWLNVRREILIETVVFCSACVVYYLWAFYNMRYHALAPVTDVAYQINHVNLSVDEITERLSLLMNFFNELWILSPFRDTQTQGWFMLLILIAGLTLGLVTFLRSDFYRRDRVFAGKRLAQVIFASVLILLLSAGFFLSMPKRVMDLRLLLGAVTAGFALLIWCVISCSQVLPRRLQNGGIFIAVGMFFLMQAYQTNVAMFAHSASYIEYLGYTKTKVADYLAQNHTLQRIHYIVPRSQYPYDKFFLSNGALLQLLGRDNYQLQWCSLSRGTEGAEQDHQAEALSCIAKLAPNEIAITYTYPEEKFSKTPNMLLIDMQNTTVVGFYQHYLKDFFNITLEKPTYA